MWKIHRYYLRELAGTSAVTFLMLFGVVLLASITRGIDRVQGGNLVDAALIVLLWTADTFPHLLTIALLVATVLTFARASQDREITALRAAGISPRVPMVPALLIGLFFSIGGSYALHQWIPSAHFHKYRVIGEAFRNFVVDSKMEGGKIAMDGFFMSWLSKDDRGHFHDVVFKIGKQEGSHATNAQGLEPGRAYSAGEAWIELAEDGETLVLSVQGIRDAAGLLDLPGRTEIKKSLRDLSGNERKENDKDLSSDQLLASVYRGLHDNPKGAEFTVHTRACFALMPFLFAPIGFCIGVLARDRGRMTAVLIAMVPMAVFYGCVMLSPTLNRSLDLPAAAWLPAVVIALLGTPFCWKLLKV